MTDPLSRLSMMIAKVFRSVVGDIQAFLIYIVWDHILIHFVYSELCTTPLVCYGFHVWKL